MILWGEITLPICKIWEVYLMEQMTYEVPDDLKSSEEKWLKIFSKKAFIAVLGTALLGFALFKTLQGFGHTNLGIILGIIPSLIAYLITTIKVPSTWYLQGAGLTIDIIILRLYIRFRKRVLYIKGYV